MGVMTDAANGTLTRKERVAIRTAATVADIEVAVGAYTTLEHAAKKLWEVYEKMVAAKPNEKVFYRTCAMKALDGIKQHMEDVKNGRR